MVRLGLGDRIVAGSQLEGNGSERSDFITKPIAVGLQVSIVLLHPAFQASEAVIVPNRGTLAAASATVDSAVGS